MKKKFLQQSSPLSSELFTVKFTLRTHLHRESVARETPEERGIDLFLFFFFIYGEQSAVKGRLLPRVCILLSSLPKRRIPPGRIPPFDLPCPRQWLDHGSCGQTKREIYLLPPLASLSFSPCARGTCLRDTPKSVGGIVTLF